MIINKKKFPYIIILSILAILLPLILCLKGFIPNSIFTIYLIPLSIYIFYKSKNIDFYTIKILIFLIVFQNLFLVIFASALTGTQMNLYILIKEILVIAVVAYSFIRYKREINLIDIFILLFISIITYSFFTTESALMAKLANMRQLILPIVLFYFGNVININHEDEHKIYKLIVSMGKLIFILGVIQFILGENLFEYLNVYDFYAKKGLEVWINNGIYPVSFVAWDLYQIFNVFILRFMSIFFEALTTGHIMALCAIIIVFDKEFMENKTSSYIWCLLFLIGTALTFSKGAYLIIMIALIYLLITKIKNKKIVYFTIGGSIAILLSVLGFVWDKVISIQMHFNGFWHNITSAKIFFGEGLGNVGVYANTFSEEKGSSGESLIGNLLGQFGLVASIIFLIIIGCIIYLNIKSDNKNKGIAIVLLIGLVIEMFLSESSVAFLSTGLYFVISGINASKRRFIVFNLKIPKV